MKRMALIATNTDSGFALGIDDCLELSICPVCGVRHYIVSDTEEFIDYNATVRVVGEYEGWDDPLEILCPRCKGLVEAVHGKDAVMQMYMDGQLEDVEEMARELMGMD